jgi:hypothetical protein
MPAQLTLHQCNLCAKGMSPKEAIAHTAKKSKPETGNGKPAKQSTSEKKAAIAAEIKAAGGEVPDAAQSVAKFKQALAATQEASENKDEDKA